MFNYTKDQAGFNDITKNNMDTLAQYLCRLG